MRASETNAPRTGDAPQPSESQKAMQLPSSAKKKRAFDIFFFTAIGLLIGFIFGFSLANRWNKEAMRSGSSMASNVTSQPSAESQLPEGHPPMDPQKQMESVRNQIEQLKQRASQNPKDFEARAQLGNLYYDVGKYDQATEWYRQALQIDPKNPDVRTDLGTAYHFLQQHDKAIEELQKVLAYSPDFPNALRNLGMIKLSGKKDTKGAIEVWERLIATNPTNPQIAQIKEWVKQLKEGKNILQ